MRKVPATSNRLEAVFNAISVCAGLLLRRLLESGDLGLLSVCLQLSIVILAATMKTNQPKAPTAIIWSNSLAMHLPQICAYV